MQNVVNDVDVLCVRVASHLRANEISVNIEIRELILKGMVIVKPPASGGSAETQTIPLAPCSYASAALESNEFKLAQ